MPADRKAITLRQAIGRSVEVDRDNGVILNIAVITAGVTRPSGGDVDPFDVDGQTLTQVAEAINASEIGVKSRMTHPEIEGFDDIQFRLGYIRNARVDGDSVRADMHFHNPQSNEALTLMDIADRDPASAGLSIVDLDAQLERSDRSETGVVLRVETIDAVDWVGSPAANPAGLLSARRSRTLLQRDNPMFTDAQLEYLRGLGLDENANAEEIQQFVEGLEPEQKEALDKLSETGEGAEPEREPAMAEDDEREKAAMAEDDEEKPAAMQEDEDDRKQRATASMTPQDVQQAVIAAQKRERKRQKEIRQIATRCGYDEQWVDRHIDNGTEINEVRRVALANLSREPSDMPRTKVRVGTDNNIETLGQAVQDAILLRASSGRRRQLVKFDNDGGVCLSTDRQPEMRNPHERANQFRGHTVLEMGRRYLMALGYSEADNMQKPQLAALLMSRPKLQSALGPVYLAHATGDFPELLADAMGKTLRQEYVLAPVTWSMWARQVTAPDFKEQKRLQLSEAGDLQAIPEGDEYHYVGLTESKQSWALTKYGVGLKFTREMLINDDLSAFDRTPQKLGRGAARKVETLAINVLTNNQLADGSTLFSSGNNNTSTGALSVTNLGEARSKLRRQTALGSDDPLELTPANLLVPESISTDAQQLVASTVDPAKSNATPNPFANQLQVIPSARLDTDSTTQWYLTADPNEIDTVEIGFLEGEEAPTVEEEDEFDSDVRKMKIRHQIAAAAIDYRGMVRSSGS